LLVKLIDCLDKVIEEERKYLETLEKYSEKMAKEGISVKYVLNKITQKIKDGVLVKYSGMKVIFEHKNRSYVEKLLLPPKFMFDGFEYILSENGVFCEYSIFRKFSKKLKCKFELVVNIETETFIKRLCFEAAKYVKHIRDKIGYDPQWIPLIASGILMRISKEYKLRVNDVRDYVAYLYDTGVLHIKFGETGEIWLNYGGLCFK